MLTLMPAQGIQARCGQVEVSERAVGENCKVDFVPDEKAATLGQPHCSFRNIDAIKGNRPFSDIGLVRLAPRPCNEGSKLSSSPEESITNECLERSME